MEDKKKEVKNQKSYFYKKQKCLKTNKFTKFLVKFPDDIKIIKIFEQPEKEKMVEIILKTFSKIFSIVPF